MTWLKVWRSALPGTADAGIEPRLHEGRNAYVNKRHFLQRSEADARKPLELCRGEELLVMMLTRRG